jgi:plasmid stability protein
MIKVMSVILKRATVYFDPELHRAVRLKAVNTNQSISDVVNDSLRAMLSEDEEDLAAFDETASDPLMTYEELLARLKADGKI